MKTQLITYGIKVDPDPLPCECMVIVFLGWQQAEIVGVRVHFTWEPGGYIALVCQCVHINTKRRFKDDKWKVATFPKAAQNNQARRRKFINSKKRK